MAGTRKNILMVCRHSPYSGQLARAALDAALAAAVFEQELSVLFMDEGIWQLLAQQHAAEIDYKSISATLDSMPLYDIETFYVDAQSLAVRNVAASALLGNTILLNPKELPVFLDGFEQVLSF